MVNAALAAQPSLIAKNTSQIRAKYEPNTSQIRAKYEPNTSQTAAKTLYGWRLKEDRYDDSTREHRPFGVPLSTALERLPRVKVDKRDEVSRRVPETGGLRLGESLQQIHARKPDARTLEHEHKVVIRLAET
nr:MAG: hypothetical protein [Apis mellifera filamentous virus]